MLHDKKDKFSEDNAISSYTPLLIGILAIFAATYISTRFWGGTIDADVVVDTIEWNIPTILTMSSGIIVFLISLKPLYKSNKGKTWKLFVAITYLLIAFNIFLTFSGPPSILVLTIPISASIVLVLLFVVLLKYFKDNL